VDWRNLRLSANPTTGNPAEALVRVQLSWADAGHVPHDPPTCPQLGSVDERRDLTPSKVMLITGGSRGIGAVTALMAAEQGYSVCVNYLSNADAAAEVVAACEAVGATALAAQGDVSKEPDVLAMFEAARSLGPLKVLINNAGILHSQSKLEAFSFERLTEVVAVNVVGAMLCAREAVRTMSTNHGGSGGAIVNVSSAASYLGSPNEYIDYASTKGAMDTMTVGLAKEVATEGIRVNAVRPGLIKTDIHASGGDPGRVERLAPNIPMQRGGESQEVANAIMWLASDEASYVTGTLVNVSGGR
jgi:NAD(P)-dependent dehydrogenase (short-subunit alcohol dehydrogenase family)